MATRNLLHHNQLEPFEAYLRSNAWTIEPTKGYFEVLRARKKERKGVLIIYRRLDEKEHYSVDDRDVKIVRSFLREQKNEKHKGRLADGRFNDQNT